MDIPQDISEFTRGIGSELNRLTHPEKGTPPPAAGYMPAMGAAGGLSFVEMPTANSAGSESFGMETPNPTMIPIPDDMREMVAEKLRSPNPPTYREHPQPQAQTPIEESAPVIAIPDKFDFDLFQFMMVKDTLARLNTIITDINTQLAVLENHKKTLESTIQTSTLNKGNQ